jgi:hypothetical protein
MLIAPGMPIHGDFMDETCCLQLFVGYSKTYREGNAPEGLIEVFYYITCLYIMI